MKTKTRHVAASSPSSTPFPSCATASTVPLPPPFARRRNRDTALLSSPTPISLFSVAFAGTRENMPAMSGPFRSVQALLSLLVCLSTLTAVVVVVDASPAYLLAQRRGQRFTYEAKNDGVVDMDSLLPNASCSFLYAFTEEMNGFIKDLVNSPVMMSFGTGAEEHGFDNCNMLSSADAGWSTSYILSGCFKALLHAGIAGDCLAENPFCCIQYWRYPASLPDRLPSDQIDPRLIFWDGTKAVNGFYTNFSDKYRALYQNCSFFRPWPECSCVYGANSTLAVDANGEWRYTRRYMPFLTYIEHRVDTPADTESGELAQLVSTSAPTWAAVHKFGDIPVLVPVVVAACFVVIFFIFVLLMYLCGYKPALKEEEELRAKIKDMQARTAEVEKKLAAKRRHNQRTTTVASAVNDPPANSIGTRASSTNSMKSAASGRSPQSFQNPPIGRQTFGV
ncbi:hypothetical protein, unknown function [Leishmania tarentolae]|uniref:Uncharacterized protein n=1 Tax=Leishmania tarentolae TaxID=5689 RepID=A0A640KD21_LEITA|nr:hypothetical protein, unknown function [Leishmania tarentolae]